MVRQFGLPFTLVSAQKKLTKKKKLAKKYAKRKAGEKRMVAQRKAATNRKAAKRIAGVKRKAAKRKLAKKLAFHDQTIKLSDTRCEIRPSTYSNNNPTRSPHL